VPVVDGLVTILPVAVSTLSIALVLFVLLGDHGLRSGIALVGGWFVGAWSVLVLGSLGVLTVVTEPLTVLLPPVRIALGVGAMLFGVAALARIRMRPGSVRRDQARMAALADALTPARSAFLGFALVGLSPRQWAFLVPAAALLSAEAARPAALGVLPVAGALVATVGVATPLLVALATQRRYPDALPRARRWWSRHGDRFGAYAAVGVGGALLASGVVTAVAG
jgi:hypothetical protein